MPHHYNPYPPCYNPCFNPCYNPCFNPCDNTCFNPTYNSYKPKKHIPTEKTDQVFILKNSNLGDITSSFLDLFIFRSGTTGEDISNSRIYTSSTVTQQQSLSDSDLYSEELFNLSTPSSIIVPSKVESSKPYNATALNIKISIKTNEVVILTLNGKIKDNYFLRNQIIVDNFKSTGNTWHCNLTSLVSPAFSPSGFNRFKMSGTINSREYKIEKIV
jgi:hypothetical protein